MRKKEFRSQNSEFRIIEVLKGIVNELTDQSAYRRYLSAHGLNPSPTAWRSFSDQKWDASAKRPKCC